MDRRNFFKSITSASAGIIMVPDFSFGWENASLDEPDELTSLFLNPPCSCGPWVIWEWLNGNVTREGITLDLEFMKRIGISGAVCACTGSEVPAGPVVYGSEEWLDYTAHAFTEATRLGLQIMLHVSPRNPIPSGSPMIRDAGLRQLVWTELRVTGNMPARLKLPQPASGMEHYRDAFVLAFPSTEEENGLIPGNQVFDPESVINLTSFLTKKGVLKWKPTAGGSWTVLRFGHTLAGSSPSGNGKPAKTQGIDIFRKEAVETCYGKIIHSILERLNTTTTKSFAGLTSESAETGILNWSVGFDTEFEKRHKYSMVPWLPALTGKIAVSRVETEKFLQDLRQTQSELISENYYGSLGRLCQNSDLAFHVISPVPGSGDIPDDRKGTLKEEYFTVIPAPPVWTGCPSLLKPETDRYFSLGSNRLLFQGFVHQPFISGWPGMTMAPFGSLFDRNNTWSGWASGFFETIRRTQFLLQKGKTVVDPDNFQENELNPADSDFVFTPEFKDTDIRFIHKTTADSEFCFVVNFLDRLEKINCSFRAGDRQPEIWDPETGEIRPVPFFENRNGRLFMPLDLAPFAALFIVLTKSGKKSTFKRVLKDGRLLIDNDSFTRSVADHPEEKRVEPTASDRLSILSFHIRQGLLTGLFLKNGNYDLILNNENSEEILTVYVEGCFEIPLPGSWTVHFPDGSRAPGSIDFPELFSLSKHDDFNIRHFSGTCRYKTIFYLADSDFTQDRKFLLDLGRVEVIARVLINGNDAGVVWKEPFVADVTTQVKKGENILEVDVTNLWVNRLIGDEYLPAENEYNNQGFLVRYPEWYLKNQPQPGERITFSVWHGPGKNDPLPESGLPGPVKLILGKEILI